MNKKTNYEKQTVNLKQKSSKNTHAVCISQGRSHSRIYFARGGWGESGEIWDSKSKVNVSAKLLSIHVRKKNHF